MRYGTACFFLLMLCSGTASAGAWMQPTGHGVAILSGYYYDTDHYFDTSGHKQSQPRFQKYELNPYLEYGLSDDWTVGASLFIDDLSQKDGAGGSESNQGLGNSQLFARTNLWQKQNLTLSAEPFVALPALYRSGGEPQSGHENFDAGAYLALGDSGAWVGEHDYAELRAGYRHRFGVLSDQAHVDAKLGLNLLRNFTLVPEVNLTLPVSGVDSSRRSVAGDNDYRLTRLQLSGVYDIDPVWSVQAGLFTHVEGENTGAGGGGLLSLWHHF